MSRIVKADRIYIDPTKRYKVDYSSCLRPKNLTEATIEPHIEDILSNLHVSNSRAEAQIIINEAVKEAEEIKAQAEDTRQQVQKEAWNKGFEAGYQDGLDRGIESAEHQYQDMLQEVQKLKEQVLAERQKLFREVEKDAVQLAFIIAEKIIHRELESDNSIILSIVRNAIDQYQIKSDMDIRISTDNIEAMNCLKSSLHTTAANVNIVCDEKLGRSDCIINLGDSEIDVGVDTQLAKLEDAFSEFGAL